jgi:hypothetical protein
MLKSTVCCKIKKVNMRNQGKFLLTTVLIAALFTSCTKTDDSSTSLKQAISENSVRLNTAIATIKSLPAYGILTMSSSDAMAKSATDESTYRVYITLDTVKGIYNYNKPTALNNWGMSLLHYFTKTAESSQMIVRLPLQKVTKPFALRHYTAADTALTNNFEIAVSDYHNNYNSYWDYDYILKSKISIDGKTAGNLNIDANISPADGKDYLAKYAFTDGYSTEYHYVSGDTTSSEFSIKQNSDVLYSEKLLVIKNDTSHFREHQYILTIGNVQIVRKPKDHDIQVLVNGVVQAGAKVDIVDNESDPEASVCKKREVQITFEDGTVKTIAELIGESVNDIKTLYSSLHQVYFSAYIVDWIAYDIYYQR